MSVPVTRVPASAWERRALAQNRLTLTVLPVNLDELHGHTVGVVRADPPFRARVSGRVRLQVNPYGALSGWAERSRTWLGLRPGEVDIECPMYAGARTVLGHGVGDRREHGAWLLEGGEGALSFTETWTVSWFAGCANETAKPSAHVISAASSGRRVTGDFRMDDHARWFGRAHQPAAAVRFWRSILGVRLVRLRTLSETDARMAGVKVATIGEKRVFLGSPAGGRGALPPIFRSTMADDGEPSGIYATALDALVSRWMDRHGVHAPEADPWVWAITHGPLEGTL